MSDVPGASGAVSISAPAKLNLWLHVVGRRADGYHLIDSLVAFAELGDLVSARLADRLSLEVDGPFAAALPAGDDNLVMRAARLLADIAGVRAGASLRLTKRLPVAAGIGGGSADAAAALRALARLWRLDLDPTALRGLALRLGADLPVCLAGAPCRVGGIGEELSPVAGLPPADLVLVNPGVPLGTAAVFAARAAQAGGPETAATAAPPPAWSAPLADAAALARHLVAGRNDLTGAAIGLAPEVAEALAALSARPGCLLARMSGSGATCFGLFADAGAAAAAAAAIGADRTGWWTAATRLAAAPDS